MRFVTLVLALGLCAATVQAQTVFTVTHTGDAGAGSLRRAIEDANANAGADVIEFNIPGDGPHTIQPFTPLPNITDPVIIDGYSQPGSAANTNPVGQGLNTVLMIELSGQLLPGNVAGLTITAGESTVRGLVINNFPRQGILLETLGGNAVEGCFVGTDVTGTVSAPNGFSGVLVDNVSDNVIGGTSAASRNLLSGGNTFHGMALFGVGAVDNRVEGNLIGTDVTGTTALGSVFFGVNVASGASNNVIGGTAAGAGNVISGNGSWGVAIHISSHDNRVAGNYIGTDVLGVVPIPNGGDGVRVTGGSTGNVIGGTDPAARNVISGNEGDGVEIKDSDTIANRVEGNYIGTDATGTATLANGNNGVEIENARGNTIGGPAGTTPGGPCTGACNLISGNGEEGIKLDRAHENVIQGNLIGTDVTGGAALGNANHGVIFINVSNRNRIGGTTREQGNTIAYNGVDGLWIDSGSGNTIEANAIFDNQKLGIDLEGGSEDPFEVTANDNRDQDGGPNQRQNFPVLTSATSGSIAIDGTLNSTPSETLTLAFYANETCDDSGHGEGQTFLGTAAVTTDSSGNVAFSAMIDVEVEPGQFVTATATGADGSTSEFSACIEVTEQVNTAPVAEDDEASTPENTAVNIDVLANDTDADGDALALSITTDPAHGEAAIEADATLTYTPDDDFVGADSLVYRVDDGNGGIDEATVRITVTSTNSPPQASQITSPEDGATLVLAGDPTTPVVVEWTAATDPDGDTVEYIWQLATTANFAEADLVFGDSTEQELLFATDIGMVATLLATAEITSFPVVLHHRVLTTDGQVTTEGPSAQVTFERGAITATEDEAEIPATYHLAQNYPNPFNPETRISFGLPVAGEVRLTVFDVLGREVAVLVDERLPAGRHETVFAADDLPSGVYVYQLQTARQTLSQRMILLK